MWRLDPIKLAQILHKQGKAMTEANRFLGRGEGYLSRAINRHTDLGIDAMAKLAEFCSCTIEDLITKE